MNRLTTLNQLLMLPSTMRGRRLLMVLCFCGALTRGQAQIGYLHGVVTSAVSKEKIALASVSWKKGGKGGVTDSTGSFSVSRGTTNDTLIISCVGYTPVAMSVNPGDSAILYIELSPRQAEGVVVRAKYSKGLFWWRKIVRHKPMNDPYRFNSFSCTLYKKLEVDLNNITREGFEKVRLLQPFGFLADNIDTVSDRRPFLPVFLKESLSNYYCSTHPAKRREEITAVRTSGIRNEAVLHALAGFEQRVDAYDNFITLFGKEFISPLSSAGDAHYDYQAADTQYIDGQRYLHLFFSPKHPGDNCFSGDCWIHQPDWAISSIDLEMAATADINFVNRLHLRQEFTRQPDSSWIFTRDQFVTELSPLKKDKLSLIARQTRIYQQVQMDQPGIAAVLEKNQEADQQVESDDARIPPAAYWDFHRPEPLSVNEQKVYKMADTLQGMPVFQSYVHSMEFIVGGRKPLGKVEIGPWYKWISGNRREDLRTRFDWATTEKFSKEVWLHGYLAYGTGDKQFKGQLEGRYRFPGNNGYAIQASYLHDLDNGKVRDDGAVTTDNLFSQFIRRPGIRQKFIMVDEIRTGVGKEWSDHFSAQLILSRTGYTTFNPLPPMKLIARNERSIINTEFGLRLRYAPGEKKIITRRKDLRVSGDHPVFQLGYAVGLPKIAGGQYHCQKLNTTINQRVHLPGWGQIDYQLYGGRIWGDALPFMLLEVHPGNETYYYSKSAFNLMSRYEYVSDRYAGFTIEHHFDKKLLRLLPLLRRVNVRQFWNIKAVWGDLSPANKKINRWEYGNYRMKSLNGQPYLELGTGLDNIFHYFRLDCVWRLAPAQAACTTIPSRVHPNPTGDFGIFGSFHIQF